MTKAATKSKGKAIEERDNKGMFQIGNFLGFKTCFNTVQEIHEKMSPYLSDCINRDLPVLISGIKLTLGINSDTYNRYIRGERDKRIKPLDIYNENNILIETVPVSVYLKRIRDISEHSLQVAGGKQKFNPVFTMFLLKNHHGYADKTEVTHSVGFDLDKLHTAKESQHAITEGPKANDPIVN